MKKILFCASTASHLINFHLPYIKSLMKMGYEVHALVDKQTDIPYVNKVLAVPFTKRLLSFKNVMAVFCVGKMISAERYDQICTNTTLAGLIVRCAVIFLRHRPRIIHIVHGYLFNLSNVPKQLHYFLPEKIVAPVSAVVVVMNEEDYQIARKYHLYRDQLLRVPGMGVNLNHFCAIDMQQRKKLRMQYKIDEDQFVILYVAEFSNRKNQEYLLKAFLHIPTELQVTLLLVGNGATMAAVQAQSEQLGLTDKIRFLGYVKDTLQFYQLSDLAVSPSKIEGLPFNLMEAMGCGLPLLASDIKGHRDLIRSEKNGILFSLKDPIALAEHIQRFASDKEMCRYMGEASKHIVQGYNIDKVYSQVMPIFTMSGKEKPI